MKKEFRAVPRPDDIADMARELRFHPASTQSPEALSGKQVEEFNRDGYLKNLRIYDDAEITGIRGFFDGLLEKTLAAGDDSYSDCVDWDKDRITVYSPKTEHHVGGELRIIPMFSELRPHLERVFEEAEEGTKYVINRRRIASQKYSTRLKKIIARAGLKPWPKLFQNMRATRQTELSAQFPLHVVCAWLGNSAPIAQKHYLQVTEQHFAEAIGGGAKSGAALAQHPLATTR